MSRRPAIVLGLVTVLWVGCVGTPAPEVRSPAPDAWIPAAGAPVSVWAPRRSDLRVTVNDRPVWAWIFPTTLGLLEGPARLDAVARYGRREVPADPLTLWVDTIPPALVGEGLTPDDWHLLTAAPRLGVTWQDDGSGVATGLVAWRATRDGEEVALVPSSEPDGAVVDLPVEAGVWRVSVAVPDVAGNTAELVWEVGVDLAPPALTVGEEPVWGRSAVALPCGVADDTGGVAVAARVFDGVHAVTGRAAVVGGVAEVPLDLSALRDGPLAVSVVATDGVGRRGTALVGRVLDRSPPSLSVAPAVAVGAERSLVLTVTDDGGVVSLVVREGGQPVATTRFPTPLRDGEVAVALEGLPDGAHPLTVMATDVAGHEALVSVDVTVDLHAPEVGWDPLPGPVIAGQPLAMLVSDVGGVDWAATASSVYVTRGGLVVPADVSLDAGRVVVRTPPLDGVWSVTVDAVDLAGNRTGPVSAQWTALGGGADLIASAPTDGDPLSSLAAPARWTFDRDVVVDQVHWRDDAAVAVAVETSGPAVTVTPLVPVAPGQAYTLRLTVHPTAGGPSTSWQRELWGPTLLEEVAAQVGLRAYRAATGEVAENHGPGAAFVDVSADGWPDLVVAGPPGEAGAVFENVSDGQGGRRFAAHVLPDDVGSGGVGAIAADYDNDGDRDLFLPHYGASDVLLRNLLVETGTLRFEDVTAQTDPTPGEVTGDDGVAGGGARSHSMSAVWVDADRDGWADLYVGHHFGWVGWGADQTPGERDTLFRNNGDGTFSDVTWAAGVPGFETATGETSTAHQRFASTDGVIATDLDLDGWPDLVVTNKTRDDLDRDMVYRNLGAGEDGVWRGFETLTYDLPGLADSTLELPMGVDAGDVDGDGDLDLAFSDQDDDVYPGPNEVWLNQVAQTGVLDFVVARWAPGRYSWGVRWADLDLDGALELFFAGNRGRPDALYEGRGLDAVDRRRRWGLGRRDDARGAVTADYDRDGWPDLFVAVVGVAPSRLMHNQAWVDDAIAGRHALRVTLVGDPSRPGPLRSTGDALGARVVVTADTDGDGVLEHLTREVRAGGGNATSSNDLALSFGLGVAETGRVVVHWPSGAVTRLSAVPAGEVTVTE